MYYQPYIETEKVQNQDGSWTITIQITDNIADSSAPDGYRYELIRKIDLRSRLEPQIQYQDYT